MPLLICLLFLSGLVLPFQNCGGQVGSSSSASSAGDPILSLYESDMAQLGQMGRAAPLVDRNFNGAFSKIFGGTEEANLRSYLNLRIKNVLSMEQLEQMYVSPAQMTYTDWLSRQQMANTENAVVMAINLGASFYLQGKVDGQTYELYENEGERYLINSTRDGLVVLGPGYVEESSDFSFSLPVELRVATLIHEGRHSDCSGGLPADFVSKARSATSNADLLSRLGVEQIQCGHLHIACPVGHDLEGVPACDADVWGAYGVEHVFNRSNLANALPGSTKRAILEAIVIDSLSRLPDTAQTDVANSSPDMDHVEPQ